MLGFRLCFFWLIKNDDPELLMEVAHWWIMEMKLDHFEKLKRSESCFSPVKPASKHRLKCKEQVRNTSPSISS